MTQTTNTTKAGERTRYDACPNCGSSGLDQGIRVCECEPDRMEKSNISKQAETHKVRMKTDKQIWSSISTVKLICSAAEYDDTRDPFLWDLAARIRTEIRRRKESWAESLIAAANSGKKITVIAVNK